MVEQHFTLHDNEVIDRHTLAGLALLAQANNHSIIEEINIALSAYVADHLPQCLDDKVINSIQAQTLKEGFGS